MFEAFAAQPDSHAPRRFAAAAGAALLTVGALGLAAALASQAPVPTPSPKRSVDVRFRPPPPPPPAPRVEPPARPQVATKPRIPRPATPEAPVAPPATAAPLLAPTEAPPSSPLPAPTAEAVEGRTLAVGGTGTGLGVTGQSSTGEGAPGTGRPIQLPENAVPPEPLASNALPEYPREARASGKEGLVILKVAVGVEGEVLDVRVLRGEEPFVSAALQAVKGWRYRPALVEGQPAAVYRVVKVPFRIRSA